MGACTSIYDGEEGRYLMLSLRSLLGSKSRTYEYRTRCLLSVIKGVSIDGRTTSGVNFCLFSYLGVCITTVLLLLALSIPGAFGLLFVSYFVLTSRIVPINSIVA